eukprot:CAMPEP_0118940958 /NCGR_PEP_ID=MMETSP1169-20130426/32760_1 /TAXON_ID=36882 /ORGANISM="Pyramimonas obovata, Strain CCMP722" /LENGTH=41 /DNA_ID= /DNA_START= /DNA_END= /DNA_ORIENTATION=
MNSGAVTLGASTSSAAWFSTPSTPVTFKASSATAGSTASAT